VPDRVKRRLLDEMANKAAQGQRKRSFGLLDGLTASGCSVESSAGALHQTPMLKYLRSSRKESVRPAWNGLAKACKRFLCLAWAAASFA
jgi:hypothetical protein